MILQTDSKLYQLLTRNLDKFSVHAQTNINADVILNGARGFFQLHPSHFEVVSFTDSSRSICEVSADVVAADNKPRALVYAVKGNVLSLM